MGHIRRALLLGCGIEGIVGLWSLSLLLLREKVNALCPQHTLLLLSVLAPPTEPHDLPNHKQGLPNLSQANLRSWNYCNNTKLTCAYFCCSLYDFFYVGVFQLDNCFVGIIIMSSLKIKYLYDEIYLSSLCMFTDDSKQTLVNPYSLVLPMK